MLVAFLAVSFIPIRYFVFLWTFGKFSKGSRYYKRRKVSNKECARIALRNWYHERKMIDFEILWGEDQSVWTEKPWPKTQDHK